MTSLDESHATFESLNLSGLLMPRCRRVGRSTVTAAAAAAAAARRQCQVRASLFHGIGTADVAFLEMRCRRKQPQA